MKTDGPNDRTFLDTLARHVRERPDAPAYRAGDRVLRFCDVDYATNQIAHALVALGVKRDDRVACLTRHHIDCLLLTLAACKVGAVCMPVNWRLARAEAAFIISHGEARFLMVDEAFIGTTVDDEAALSNLQQIVCTERAKGAFPSFAQWYAPYETDFTPVSAGPEDAALQLYSSGTTGLPKGVVLSHANLLYVTHTISRAWGFTAASVHGNAMPTFHVGGMVTLLYTLYTGGLTCAYSEFDPADFIASIGRHGITHTFLVPAMLLFMLQSPTVTSGDYHTLKLIAYGGAPISEPLLREAISVFHCDFGQIYGMTEVTGPCTYLRPEDHCDQGTKSVLLRSAGKPIEGAAIRIVDPATGQDLPDGEAGEVWIESDGSLKEYWRDPDATARIYPEGRQNGRGWLRSGDCAYRKDDYIYVVDRLKDMIISGGENIYPAEVENTLMGHPAVADCGVIGVPDERWGETVKACVVLRPGAVANEGDIIAWMRERMAHFKCPKTVMFMDSLPRNPTGKILKRVLREPYWHDKNRRVN